VTLAFAAVLLLAGPPRFLGPPEKKPQDGDPPAVAPGDDAPALVADVRNAQGAGVARFDLAAVVRPGSGVAAVLIGFCDGGERCERQLRALQDVGARDAARGLRVVAVHTDAASIAPDVTVPVVSDPGGSIARRYLGAALRFPSLAIVDAKGKVAVVKKGYVDDPATFLAAQVAAALP